MSPGSSLPNADWREGDTCESWSANVTLGGMVLGVRGSSMDVQCPGVVTAVLSLACHLSFRAIRAFASSPQTALSVLRHLRVACPAAQLRGRSAQERLSYL